MSWLPACWETVAPRTIEKNRTAYTAMARPRSEYLLLVVDYFIRLFEVAVTKSVTSGKMISCLEAMFATHGLSLSIKTDNGPQFVSEEFEVYLKDNNIEH